MGLKHCLVEYYFICLVILHFANWSVARTTVQNSQISTGHSTLQTSECDASCSENEECYFVVGDFTSCRCKEGYANASGNCWECLCGENEQCGFDNNLVEKCSYLEGYERVGDDCQEIDMCKSNPCKNGGSCTATFTDYNCICDKLHTGKQCEIEIDFCKPNTCKNGGNCTVSGTDYNCTCDKLHTGKNCEMEIDFCEPNPCKNGGNCTVKGSDYNCLCDKLHSGKNCEIEIRPCDLTPCLNGGTCQGNGSSFLCQCQKPYTGKVCEKRDDFNTNIPAEMQRLQLFNLERYAVGQGTHKNESSVVSELLNVMTMLQNKLRV